MTQPDPSNALRCIPSLDAFLRRQNLASVTRGVAARESRRFLDSIRSEVLAGNLGEADVSDLFDSSRAEHTVLARCDAAQATHHGRVINATGIVLHTGIGRAPLAAAAQAAIVDAAGYAIVEVDPKSGVRNQREVCISMLLEDILGVEAALVVNNNAAATTLVLAALASGREVITSRGELVEIGGGFRVPDVMRQAGCRMVEVGTTNRTHLSDYESAIGPDTAMVLKVHTSNYRVVGFHGTPDLSELVTVAHQHGLLAVEDLGSGLVFDGEVAGLVNEPRVSDSVATGADLVCFSGDKLLGGPQAGILVGNRDVVARVRAHPMYRAMRCDKLTLAALEATLRIYRDGDPGTEIPVLCAVGRTREELREPADRLVALFAASGSVVLQQAVVIESDSFAGSGANPAHPIPSLAVAVPGGERVCEVLRNGPGIPVFTRIAEDRVLLDMRSLEGEDLDLVATEVIRKLSGSRG
ncbi:MAG: L-seryl-tRNA(Sec) selenium transferase [Planctomycetota bacterium]|nr:L-seryl-tRNA(Sec) selenium transferase [Planctomycetota bacterium]